jgi:antimicrobial peptide system SdpA family protein
MDPLSRSDIRVAAWTFTLGAVCVAVLTLVIARSRFPRGPLELSGRSGYAAALLLPQGWKFFTKDPRSSELYAYASSAAGEWRAVSASAMSSSENLHGLDRRVRTQGLEIGLILSEVPKPAHWADCAGTVAACAASVDPVDVHNRSPVPTLCGDIALTREQPVPWAWRHLRYTSPFKLTRVRVQCAH